MAQESSNITSSFSNLTTTQKVAIVGGLASLAAAAAYLLKTKETTPSGQPKSTTAKLPSKSVENDPNIKQAAELKEEGNKAFKVGKYDEAIEFYTRALKLSDHESHLLFSNRSAAYVAMNNFEDAVRDAKKCIELKPDWSKGYFRLGKAQLSLNEVSEAFVNFYRGYILEPKNEELKRFLESTKSKLPPFGKRATKFINQAKLINLYLESIAVDYLSDVGADFETVKQIIEAAYKSKQLDEIVKTNPLLQECATRNEAGTYAAVALILLVCLEHQEAAVPFARKALSLDPENPRVLIVTTLVLIRQTKYVFRTWEDAAEILEFVKTALIMKPNDLFIAHTYMGFVATLVPSLGQADCPIDIPAVLQDLRVCLSNPETDKLQIAHTGIQIWFKFFEDPNIQRRLYEEEQRSEISQMQPDQAYLQGLLHGAFHDLCMNPFFIQALAESVLPFPQLERILCPFRSAIASIKVDQKKEYEKVESFLYSLAMQCYKNNYVWDIKPEEQRRLDQLLKETSEMLQNMDQLVTDGVMSSTLHHHISIISMYQPLSLIPNIESLVLKLDFSRLNPTLVNLLTQSVLSLGAEREIEESLEPLTPIPESDLVRYNNEYLGATWDSPPNPCLIKVPVQEELKWRFPNHNLRGFTDKTRILIAGCGTGKEVHSIVSAYQNIEVSAVDFSKKRLAYAIRQNRELGVDNVSYYWADIAQLTPTHFNDKKFDVIIANDLIHFLPDPLKGWERLAGLLRSGGIMHVTLHNKRAVTTLKDIRSYLATKFTTHPLFDGSDLPKVTRVPTNAEVREARKILLDALENGVNLPSLAELISTLSFYTLNEFRELVFHPVVHGFSYTTVTDCCNRLGLKIVGFEFPEILNEKELTYRGEFPQDQEMLHGPSLDKFDEDPQAFTGFYITFSCEKK